jgi:hypothetical protein
LEIPAGTAVSYRLAQLDDTSGLARERFAHHEIFTLALRARAAARGLPGTWGFGFGNEPFGFGLGQGGGLRLPAMPNAAWFFHASADNYLSLRDDLPASGFLAQVFQAPPTWPFLPFAPGLVLLAWPAAARLLRKVARVLVREAGSGVELDTSEWHRYRIDCAGDWACFEVDEQVVLQTAFMPRGRLGLVLWIDNQYAAFAPDGRIRAGFQENLHPAWVEIEIERG